MKTMATKYARPTPNWPVIELLYTKTDESVRRIANLHDVSHTAIQKRATRRRWVKFYPPDEPVPLPLTEDVVPSVPNPRGTLPQSGPREGANPLEAAKQSGPQELVEHARSVVATLLDHLDAAIARKDIRSPARASAVKSLAGAAKQLIDGAVGKPMGKKEQQDARAKELARSGRFPRQQPPPRFLSGRDGPADENQKSD